MKLVCLSFAAITSTSILSAETRPNCIDSCHRHPAYSERDAECVLGGLLRIQTNGTKRAVACPITVLKL
jgi:hypothetical protein